MATRIVSGARTPIGRLSGAYTSLSAADLGGFAISAALERAGVAPEDVDHVIMGQVLMAGQGQVPARQAAAKAGIAMSVPSVNVNKVCLSGLNTVYLAHQMIASGDADIVVAGGMESMTNAPHILPGARSGFRYGDSQLVDAIVHDGLWCAFNGYHMGNTAENVARKWQLTREEQDVFAVASQNKAEAAQKTGRFNDEIVAFTVKTRKGETVVDQDEYIRHGASLDQVAKLRPAFSKEGTVTAANASGINDGAAAVVLMSADEAEKRGITPMARIVSYATVGLDPAIMGVGPIYASRKALDKAGWTVDDLDLVEANEAFAGQACAVNKDLGWDTDKVNVNGGAIAIGHPIGASGARVLTTLLYEMQKRDAKKGLATLCIGGGMGIAMCVERD